MDKQEQIAFGNLQGHVEVLTELVKVLVDRALPFDPSTGQLISAAVERARKAHPDGSPERIAVDHAINTLHPWDWQRRR